MEPKHSGAAANSAKLPLTETGKRERSEDVTVLSDDDEDASITMQEEKGVGQVAGATAAGGRGTSASTSAESSAGAVHSGHPTAMNPYSYGVFSGTIVEKQGDGVDMQTTHSFAGQWYLPDQPTNKRDFTYGFSVTPGQYHMPEHKEGLNPKCPALPSSANHATLYVLWSGSYSSAAAAHRLQEPHTTHGRPGRMTLKIGGPASPSPRYPDSPPQGVRNPLDLLMAELTAEGIEAGTGEDYLAMVGEGSNPVVPTIHWWGAYHPASGRLLALKYWRSPNVPLPKEIDPAPFGAAASLGAKRYPGNAAYATGHLFANRTHGSSAVVPAAAATAAAAPAAAGAKTAARAEIPVGPVIPAGKKLKRKGEFTDTRSTGDPALADHARYLQHSAPGKSVLPPKPNEASKPSMGAGGTSSDITEVKAMLGSVTQALGMMANGLQSLQHPVGVPKQRKAATAKTASSDKVAAAGMVAEASMASSAAGARTRSAPGSSSSAPTAPVAAREPPAMTGKADEDEGDRLTMSLFFDKVMEHEEQRPWRPTSTQPVLLSDLLLRVETLTGFKNGTGRTVPPRVAYGALFPPGKACTLAMITERMEASGMAESSAGSAAARVQGYSGGPKALKRDLLLAGSQLKEYLYENRLSWTLLWHAEAWAEAVEEAWSEVYGSSVSSTTDGSSAKRGREAQAAAVGGVQDSHPSQQCALPGQEAGSDEVEEEDEAGDDDRLSKRARTSSDAAHSSTVSSAAQAPVAQPTDEVVPAHAVAAPVAQPTDEVVPAHAVAAPVAQPTAEVGPSHAVTAPVAQPAAEVGPSHAVTAPVAQPAAEVAPSHAVKATVQPPAPAQAPAPPLLPLIAAPAAVAAGGSSGQPLGVEARLARILAEAADFQQQLDTSVRIGNLALAEYNKKVTIQSGARTHADQLMGVTLHSLSNNIIRVRGAMTALGPSLDHSRRQLTDALRSIVQVESSTSMVQLLALRQEIAMQVDALHASAQAQ